MAYDLYNGAPDDQQAKIAWLMQLFQHARQHRVNFEVQAEEGCSIVWPEYRNSFAFGHMRAPGVKYTQYQVDSTAAIKAMRFAAICDALLTPHHMMWAKYEDTDPDIMRDRSAKLYYDAVTRFIWNLRYRATSNFVPQAQTNWQALGVFGNIGMLVENYDARPQVDEGGFRYNATGFGEIYILQNHQGRVDGFIRHFRWTARQAYNKWGDALPPQLKTALEKADVYTMFDFLQFVVPRTDYDPLKLFTPRGKPWASIYVSVVGYSIVEEGGYYSFPLAHGRYSQAPEEWYGRGPTQQILPELKTKNTEKDAFLRQGAAAGNPTYLLPSDDLFDFKPERGAFNYGGVNEEGRPLVHVLPTGNIQITKELMADSDKIIDAAYLNDLFPALFDKDGRQKSAREVVEVANQQAIFLAPTLGRQYGEYLGSMGAREYDLARRMKGFPRMPPILREAGSRPNARYTSPLARALNAQGIAGLMRSVEMTAQIVQATGDPSHFDVYDFETAVPEMSEQQFTPIRWMASPQQLAEKRKARQQQREREFDVKSMPGRAAIAKAQAIQAKAATGGNIGGTLSGTPPGGMPMVPPQVPPGVPGQPGVGGRPGLPGRRLG